MNLIYCRFNITELINISCENKDHSHRRGKRKGLIDDLNKKLIMPLRTACLGYASCANNGEIPFADISTIPLS